MGLFEGLDNLSPCLMVVELIGNDGRSTVIDLNMADGCCEPPNVAPPACRIDPYQCSTLRLTHSLRLRWR